MPVNESGSGLSAIDSDNRAILPAFLRTASPSSVTSATPAES
jgi:hypothetical protein